MNLFPHLIYLDFGNYETVCQSLKLEPLNLLKKVELSESDSYI